jgi:hypothetical protein
MLEIIKINEKLVDDTILKNHSVENQTRAFQKGKESNFFYVNN